MNKLKLNQLSKHDLLKNDELRFLKGGEEPGGSLFCSCSCGCGTDDVKRSNRRSTRKFNKSCTSGTSTD